MAPQQQQTRKQSSLPAGYVEDNSKGPMLRFEESLPKLPVPTLEETAKRYLKSVQCLLSETEYKKTQKAVEEFIAPGGQGQTLQKRLEARAADPRTKNWLTEWWDNTAYLGYKDPVVPYVSYFYSHRDDRKRRDPAKRAAAISFAALDFKRQVDEGTLEPERMKSLPISMSSYYYMFNACRIPDRKADFVKKYKGSENPFLLVIRKGQLWKLPHDKHTTCAELEEQFKRIYKSAESSPALGMLTTENRDRWADARERLIKTSPANQAALETVEAASFVVCLDDAAPVTLNERAHQYWHGNGQGRWFDKPIQFIINDNGTSGFCGEHSMMDGTPTHRLNDYVCDVIARSKLDFDNQEKRSGLAVPSPIKFVLSAQNQEDIAQATANHVKLIAQHELRVEAYQGYGKDLIKKFKASPDGFVQLLLQLAYAKMYGVVRPVYESAATRRFQDGRTETCRSVSVESVEWCQAMNNNASPEQCRELFRKALASQGQYITDASAGKGVDRHLFGLKKSLKDGEPVPAIFQDPAFTYSCTWYISSSQLSSEYYNGYGWSQVQDLGFGCAYMINSNSIQFNIVSKHMGSERLAFYLNEAAGDLRDLLLPEVETPKAKL